jgi:hypothetical protein
MDVMDDELYDDFLFHAEASQYDRDLASCTSSSQEEACRRDQDIRALDAFVGMLTAEARGYLMRQLAGQPAGHERRTNYSALKNTESQKEVRQTLLLVAGLISRGDAQKLLVDTTEDLHLAKDSEPFAPGYRKRQRTTKSAKTEDLAARLLTNLGSAYKSHTKKRSEKKRLLSIAAPEITYAEGRRVFGCGPGQFSRAKKLAETSGPFSDGKSPSEESSSSESKGVEAEDIAEQILAVPKSRPDGQ